MIRIPAVDAEHGFPVQPMRQNAEENLTIVRLRMKLTFPGFRHGMQELVLLKHGSDSFTMA